MILIVYHRTELFLTTNDNKKSQAVSNKSAQSVAPVRSSYRSQSLINEKKSKVKSQKSSKSETNILIIMSMCLCLLGIKSRP